MTKDEEVNKNILIPFYPYNFAIPDSTLRSISSQPGMNLIEPLCRKEVKVEIKTNCFPLLARCSKISVGNEKSVVYPFIGISLIAYRVL